LATIEKNHPGNDSVKEVMVSQQIAAVVPAKETAAWLVSGEGSH
jgi:hypothetical protein